MKTDRRAIMRTKSQCDGMVPPVRAARRLAAGATIVAAQAIGGLAAILLPGGEADAAQAKHPAKQVVVIWKSQEAHQQARALIDKGALQTDPDAVNSLVACIVPNGTELKVVKSDEATDDVEVTSGQFKGCKGNTIKDYVVE